jgi:hypothetical protein
MRLFAGDQMLSRGQLDDLKTKSCGTARVPCTLQTLIVVLSVSKIEFVLSAAVLEVNRTADILAARL